MTRRQTKNITGIKRINNIPYHEAWIAYICINCKELNVIKVGNELLDPEDTYNKSNWECIHCRFMHSKNSDIPLVNWNQDYRTAGSNQANSFWKAFFRNSTEHKESYWKQCNVCGRILPFHDFSKHKKWGPLERQMECRSCKGAINAKLNPLRTKQQLHESSVKRRIADLLLEKENVNISINELFKKFDSRCFKTGKKLDIENRKEWAIDHILPSKYLYPLNKQNAALLSKEANNAKSDKWPSKFYTNSELIKLSKITGANLELLSSKEPIINTNINVNKLISRYLEVRERSNLNKRINELKSLIISYDLFESVSEENKLVLGL